jgi:hypothetical protein
MSKRSGWFRESKRHSLSAKGVKTGRKSRIRNIKTIDPHGDFDRDRVPNKWDCDPCDPKKHWTGEKSKSKIPYEVPGDIYYDATTGTFIMLKNIDDEYAYFSIASRTYNDLRVPTTLKEKMRHGKIILDDDGVSPNNYMPIEEFNKYISDGTLFNVDEHGEASEIHKVPNIAFDEEGWYIRTEFNEDPSGIIGKGDRFYRSESKIQKEKEIPMTESESHFEDTPAEIVDIGKSGTRYTGFAAKDMMRKIQRSNLSLHMGSFKNRKEAEKFIEESTGKNRKSAHMGPMDYRIVEAGNEFEVYMEPVEFEK